MQGNKSLVFSIQRFQTDLNLTKYRVPLAQIENQAILKEQSPFKVRQLIPDWPGWLACEEHTPLVAGDDGCADFAAEAAELVGHEAFDRQEAKT